MPNIDVLTTRVGLLVGKDAWGAAHKAIEDYREQCDYERKQAARPLRELAILDCGLPADLAWRLDKLGFLTVGEVIDLNEKTGLLGVLTAGVACRLRFWLSSQGA